MVKGASSFTFDYRESFKLENQTSNLALTRQEYENLMKITPVKHLYVQIFCELAPGSDVPQVPL